MKFQANRPFIQFPGWQSGGLGRSFLTMLLLLIPLLWSSAQAAEPVSKSRFKGVAIGGHDTVEYHTLERVPQAKAVKGQKTFKVVWKGATWRFRSRDAAERFAATPEKFAPAYNGFCANALSLGKGLLKTDGTHWEIFGDQLYLFYAAAGRDRWVGVESPAEFIEQADAEWTKLSKK